MVNNNIIPEKIIPKMKCSISFAKRIATTLTSPKVEKKDAASFNWKRFMFMLIATIIQDARAKIAAARPMIMMYFNEKISTLSMIIFFGIDFYP